MDTMASEKGGKGANAPPPSSTFQKGGGDIALLLLKIGDVLTNGYLENIKEADGVTLEQRRSLCIVQLSLV